jgi:ATP-dependent protease ClpP protease subunit
MSILINSNGGDLMKSYELVMHMNTVPNLKFKCYALNAYSSAFVIFQYCNERYVLSNSLLIHHNGSITIKGSFEIVKDFIENDFKVMQLIHDKINKNIAERINMSYSNFMNKIHNNWVISGGENIIKNNLADEIVNMNGFDFFV